MKKPLVSVYIVTYNSSMYILDALNSVKAQTYDNIELIVSDDCSTDNTIEIVREWLDKNKDVFRRVQFLTVPYNTGVSANVNRARKACMGSWCKGFAGDDMLLPTCIEDNVKYVTTHNDAQIVLSNSIVFFDDSDKILIQKPGLDVPGFFDMSEQEQFEQLISHNEIIMNPNSQFASTNLLKSLVVDDRIKFMEDRQFYWNCTKNGIKIHYLNKETVKYRKHSGALTGTNEKRLLSTKYFDSWTLFYYLIRKDEMEKRNIDTSKDEKKIMWYLFVKHVLKNRSNILTRAVDKLVHKFLM